MNIKFLVPALLVLCGAAYVSPVHAAVYRCMMFSGADGKTLEKSTNNDAKYEVKANSVEEAQAAAIKKVSGIKKATMTRAQCDLDSSKSGAAASASASTTTAPAPAAAPAPPPATPAAGGGETMYCMIYEGSQDLAPPSALAAEPKIWRVPVKSIQSSEDDAVALAKAQGMNADSAMCEGSAAAFHSESY